jgi:hypothetical protein
MSHRLVESGVHLMMGCSQLNMWGMTASAIDLRQQMRQACERRFGSPCTLADPCGARLSSVEKR